MAESLYELSKDRVDYEAVETFVRDAKERNALTESVTLEFKEKVHDRNVVLAIAALANTDGGLVLVGVSERADAADPIVGVERPAMDSLVNQLREQVPEFMPEIIPVAIPGTTRLVLVIRVDANEPAHPVVVRGQVVYRAPGQTVPADRERILALTTRDSRSSAGADGLHVQSLPQVSFQPDTAALFEDGDAPSLVIRFYGGVTLPGRAAARPWLDTSARTHLLDALLQSPIPDLVWEYPNPRRYGYAPQWEVTRATSSWFRAAGEASDAEQSHMRGPRRRAGVLVDRSELQIRCLLGLGVWTEAEQKVSVADLYEALLALAVAHQSACVALAEASGAGQPRLMHWRSAWLQSPTLRFDQILRFDRYERHGSDDLPPGIFPPTQAAGERLQDLDELVRAWLTMYALDAGFSGVEEEITRLELPDWTLPLRKDAGDAS